MKTIFIPVTLIFLLVNGTCLFAQDHKFTGYATALVDQDHIIRLDAFGFRNKEKESKYSTNTIQPIGSVSKTFIGISIMIAKEKGMIDLDADINRYLDFDVKNPNIKGNNRITIRQLANHTSGIIDNPGKYQSAYREGFYKKGSLRTFLYDYFSNTKTNAVNKNFNKSIPGTRYTYSNIGAALAAYIIERVSGQSFSRFTSENIFNPLGMTSTAWFYKDIDFSKTATLYDEKDRALKTYSLATYPDGGLKTSIKDLSVYLIELIKGYNGTSTFLNKDLWKELYRKNFTGSDKVRNINPKEPDNGIFMVYFRSGKIGHTGSDPGVSCMMMFDPKTNIGQLFMANEDLTKDNLPEFKNIWKALK